MASPSPRGAGPVVGVLVPAITALADVRLGDSVAADPELVVVPLAGDEGRYREPQSMGESAHRKPAYLESSTRSTRRCA